MYKKLVVVGVAYLMGLSVMTHIADAQEQILGPWLWMIAQTEANQGGQAATDVDSLDDASKGKVTEKMVAENGAEEGDEVCGFEWTPGELPVNGDINACVVNIGLTKVADFNDVTSYALIILNTEKAQSDVTMGISSDDSTKVWLNGAVVHNNPVNRGRGGTPVNIDGYQDKFQVNLKKGANLLMVKVSERGGGWGMHVGVDAEFDHNLNFEDYEHVDGGPAARVPTQWGRNKRMTGPWLWMIAPADANQGGQAATDVDSLDDASRGKVTEEEVAKDGAKKGDVVGDYAWTVGTLPANGDINAMLVSIGMTKVADLNDYTSYALLTLRTTKAQRKVTMGVNSDDSIKVWLNGEVVHTNAVNRGRGNANTFQDTFEVDLNRGSNLLMVKVSERGGGWGMFVGIDAEFALGGTPGSLPVEPTGKLVTQWGQIKRAH